MNLVAAPNYLRHINACNRFDIAEFVPVWIGGAAIGLVHKVRLDFLAKQRDCLRLNESGVHLRPAKPDDAATLEARHTINLNKLAERLVETKAIKRLRGEAYAVASRFGDPPLAAVDRAAVPYFGFASYGVHMNGYVPGANGSLELWIGKRASNKDVAPGKLDNLVAGGLPYGLSVEQNLIKECAEEASINAALARQARPVGAICYSLQKGFSVRIDTLFIYDLSVPINFIPKNADGELESFSLYPVADVLTRVAETNDFKFNVNLVLIDFAIRHGFIRPDYPDYLTLIAGLRRPPPERLRRF